MGEDREAKDGYKLRPETIVISGSARLPENVAAKHIFGCFTAELEIDPLDEKIVDASCTIMPLLGEKILYNALLGHKVKEGIKNAVSQIETRFFSVTKRAVISALEDAYKGYTKFQKEGKV